MEQFFKRIFNIRNSLFRMFRVNVFRVHHTHTKLISDLKSGDYRNNKFTLSTAVVGYTRAINIHCVNLDMGF